jgi:hypothetical protein
VQHLVTGERQLFDLERDPFELENLVGRPEVADLERELERELMKWREDGPEGK